MEGGEDVAVKSHNEVQGSEVSERGSENEKGQGEAKETDTEQGECGQNGEDDNNDKSSTRAYSYTVEGKLYDLSDLGPDFDVSIDSVPRLMGSGKGASSKSVNIYRSNGNSDTGENGPAVDIDVGSDNLLFSSDGDGIGTNKGNEGTVMLSPVPVPVNGGNSSSGHNKYYGLIDMGGLARTLKDNDECMEVYDKRITRVEKLIDRFPNDYVSALDVRESTERIEFLSQKIKRVLDSSERTQKVDQVKVQGEIQRISAAMSGIDTRISRFESETRTLHEAVNEINLRLANKVNADELRATQAQFASFARKSELSDLGNELSRYARKEDLAEMQRAVNSVTDQAAHRDREVFNAQISNIKAAMSLFANTDEVERVEDKVLEAIDRTRQAQAGVDTITGQMDGLAEQVDSIFMQLDDKASKAQVQNETSVITGFVESKVEELRSAQTRVADQVEAMSDTVNSNFRNIENCQQEVKRLEEGLGDCISSSDWEQIEADLVETFAAKAQVTKTIEPIVKKLNQVVAKLVDLDKILATKAETTTVVENREHIQDIFKLLAGGATSTVTGTSGNADNSSHQTIKVPSPARPNKSIFEGELGFQDSFVAPVSSEINNGTFKSNRRGSISANGSTNANIGVSSAQLNKQLEEQKEYYLSSFRTFENGMKHSKQELEATIAVQQRSIESLRQQIEDLRNLIMRKNGESVDLSDERPVVGSRGRNSMFESNKQRRHEKSLTDNAPAGGLEESIKVSSSTLASSASNGVNVQIAAMQETMQHQKQHEQQAQQERKQQEQQQQQQQHPRRPSRGAITAAAAASVQVPAHSLDAEKERWDKSERERWLIETRSSIQNGTNHVSSSDTSSTTTSLPKLD